MANGKGLYPLLFAQFLTAFADNAILFTAIAMLMHAGQSPSWYIPALQSAFLVAFVVLAPWVGPFADRRPKALVLMLGNALKGIGAAAILVGIEPLFAYALVGIGAAVYGPAKYGILPEIVTHERLVLANGWVEGSTIAAIIAGTVVGARVADHSVAWALMLVMACYACSLTASFWIPQTRSSRPSARRGLKPFISSMCSLFATSRARFAMLGTSLFWAAAAVLRLVLVAWAPAVLLTRSTADIADLTLALAIGIVIGAILVSRLIPIERLRRARLAAYAMGVFILVLSQIESVWPARVVLVAIGIAGGLFMVPVNAALQEIGHRTIGSGGAVALQNFFENVAMLTAVGIYAAATSLGATAVPSTIAVGILVLLATFAVSWHLPRDPRRLA
jgi:MFS transporter, LPLT family, lysophospholipid transporter